MVELLIAICIFSLIVIGFSSIDTFSRYHVLTSDRRMKLQNEASYVLEHMAKEINKAIGSRAIAGQDPINLTSIDGDAAIRTYIDYNLDGQRGTGDRWIAYRYRSATAPASYRYQIWYYPEYVSPSSPYEVIAKKIFGFSCSVTDNYVNIQIIARWDPAQSASINNPEISLRNRISMPAVSTH